MNYILHILIKELHQTLRDKHLMAMIFISPIIQLFLFSYAANLDIKNVSMAIYDQDKSEKSRSLIESFYQSTYFTPQAYLNNENEIDLTLNKGNIPFVLVIPKNFENKLLNNEESPIQVIVDGSNANSANIYLGYTEGLINQLNQKITLLSLNHSKKNQSTVLPITRIWYNPDLSSFNFIVPGILVVLLMLLTMLLTSLGIVKEREIGTLEQINVTPIPAFALILGKLLPFFILGIIDFTIVLIVAIFWFKVSIAGNIFLLFTLTLIFLLNTLGLGLLVSTFSKNQQQAMMICVFFLILPMIFLSGFIFPIQNMPYIVQKITYIIPMRYFFIIVRGIFLKGNNFLDLWQESLILISFGIGILFLSIYRFNKTRFNQ